MIVEGYDRIELLAPAKNLACGVAALDHGADAVYIGGPGFSARSAAANSVDDIKELVQYAHLFGARVYVALNTLLDDDELVEAASLCHQLYDAGVDALIIQDTGLLMMDLPPIELHASTQMNNRTPERVRFWQDVGFAQVVLARELSLEQIRAIREKTEVVLEAFVHGALCVSYSGQCYISEVMAGRSANRGECAQFCRHRFDLKDEDGKILMRDKYLLSLRDLDLSSQLQSLVDVGVRSFKIEGRLKGADYVKNVTAHYRRQLDRIIEASPGLIRASSGDCTFSFTPDPAKSFSRGRTSYFLTKKRNPAAEIRSPKSLGKLLGRVKGFEKGAVLLEALEVVENGDGLCFYNRKDELVGIRINRAEGPLLYPKGDVRRLGLEAGMEVYRNADVAFSKALERSEKCRKIGVELALEEIPEGLRLTVTDEDAVQAVATLEVAGERAKNPDSLRYTALRQLQKSGGTVFRIDNTRVNLEKELFYPAAAFNELRRKVLASLTKKRVAHFSPQPVPRRTDCGRWPDSEVSYLDNIRNKMARQFYLTHGVERIAATTLRATEVDEPQLMITKYCVRAQIGRCPRTKGAAQGAARPLYLVDNTGEYELFFDCRKCEMQVRLKR